MSLLDAPEYDPRKGRRRNVLIVVVVVILVAAAFSAWYFRNWREEHAVDQFLTAVEHKDYDQAFADWNADPEWKQHPERYKNYNFGQFQLDWGPSGDYGAITHHKVRGSAPSAQNTAVIVAVTINDRADPVALIVNRKTKAIGFSPVGVRINTF